MEIRVRSLTLSYPAPGPFGLGRRRRPAVRGLNLEVASGEVVSLAGRNGSGKSTTLRLLAGLLRPDSGEALLGGIPATRSEARRRLGYVAEEDDFPAGLRVRDVLRYAAALAGQRGAVGREQVEAATEATELGEWLDEPASRCSRGVRRRVSLAQALVGKPAALVLDEPLTGLDPVARGQAVAAIRRAAAEGAAVIVSLHDAFAIEAVADRLIVLAQGAVLAAGPAEEFAAIRDGATAAPGGWLAALLRHGKPDPS